MAAAYYVAAELSLKGCIATVTARNAPGVDILASSTDGSCSVMIQVKGNKPGGTRNFWLLGETKICSARNLFFVFANLHRDGARPDFYVATSEAVAKGMIVSRRPNSTFYSYPRIAGDKDAWHRMGLFDE